MELVSATASPSLTPLHPLDPVAVTEGKFFIQEIHFIAFIEQTFSSPNERGSKTSIQGKCFLLDMRFMGPV